MQREQEGARVRGRVMIVDDDVMVSSALRRTLAREHDVEVVTSSRQALEMLKGPKGAEVDVVLCDGKRQACRYFFGWELPRTGPQFDLLERLDDTTLEMLEAWF